MELCVGIFTKIFIIIYKLNFFTVNHGDIQGADWYVNI